MAKQLTRCSWSEKHDHERKYHDTEWGVPVYNDRLLFELLILEGAQAGVSWSVVLKKRERYRDVFDNFEASVIQHYSPEYLDELMLDAGIIRNKLKIHSVVKNAVAFLEVQKEFGSFSAYIWKFVGGEPIQNAWTDASQVPAQTAESQAMSKALKKRGFKFVGPTICYAFMQAVGMVNDHTTDCFRYTEV